MSWLPTLNASLNAVAAMLLLAAYLAIRRRNVSLHRQLMLAAFACSALFLVSYLIYHAQAGSRRFPGEGTWRTIYLTILATHSALAAIVPFGAVIALRRALAGQYDSHRRLARWIWPIWMYVSVTGVVIYWMLYRVRWT